MYNIERDIMEPSWKSGWCLMNWAVPAWACSTPRDPQLRPSTSPTDVHQRLDGKASLKQIPKLLSSRFKRSLASSQIPQVFSLSPVHKRNGSRLLL